MTSWQTLTGQWLPRGSSQAIDAEMSINDQGRFRVQTLNQVMLAQGQLSDVHWSDHLPGVARVGELAEGRFSCPQTQALQACLAQHHRKHWSLWLSHLETGKAWILATLLLTLAIVGCGMVFGVPWLSQRLAHSVPEPMVEVLGRETTAIIDRIHFKPSRLEPEQQQQLQAEFAPILAQFPQLPLWVEFRAADSLGANAMALPHGLIIFTDDLVEQSEHTDELVTILLHEVAHVHYRHGLHQVIQSSFWALSFALLTGEVGSTAEWLAAAPLVLASLNYSRRFEYEADAFAYEQMLALNIDPIHFVRALNRLTYGSDCKQLNELAGCAEAEPLARFSNYLSTHPETQQRLQRLMP